MKSTNYPLKIAVIGCGNIAQAFHLPILKYQNQAKVLWLVDVNPSNLKKAALWHPSARQTTNLKDIEGVDAVLIATPPGLHYDHVKFALDKGLHVFVEKPLAINYRQARELVGLARERGLNLCVNLNRRFLPHIKILRNLISNQPFGPVKNIKVFDGGRWADGPEGGITYHSSFRLIGGGVLLETGSHMLDLGLFLLPVTAVNNVEYCDDGATNLEAECRFSLDLMTEDQAMVTLQGFFSGIAPLSKKIEIQFEKATVKADLSSQNLEIFGLNNIKLPLTIPVNVRGDSIVASFFDSFSDFIKGCQDKNHRSVNRAATALLSLETIDRCYQSKKPLSNPWGEIIAPFNAHNRSAGSSKKVIGIIGAGGFLGSRLFARLLQDDRYVPRAVSYSSLGSFAVLRHTEAVDIGDARSPDFLRKALKGVDVVVNCAINMNGTRRSAINATRAIARNSAQIAGELGVKRFVQISTIAVHGVFLGRKGDPLRLDPARSTYALAKRYSEEDVLKECKKGAVDSVILRIGHIYGPYALGWTIGQRDLVRSNSLLSVDRWRNPSNTVFVDNVIDAIISAIEHPAQIDGQVFYITDVPNKTWREFYEPLFMFLGKDITQVPDISFKDLQKIMKFYQRNIFRQSIEFIQEMLFQPILQKEHLKNMREKRKYQKLFNMIETIMPDCFFRYLKKTISRTSAPMKNLTNQRIDGIIFDMVCSYASSVEIPTTEAVAKLGYRPSFDFDRARQITIHWLKSLE